MWGLWNVRNDCGVWKMSKIVISIIYEAEGGRKEAAPLDRLPHSELSMYSHNILRQFKWNYFFFYSFCVSGVNTTLDGSGMHGILYKNTLAFWTRSAISSHSASHFFCVSGGIADAERVLDFGRPYPNCAPCLETAAFFTLIRSQQLHFRNTYASS